jgi:hypothetical protein
MLLPSGESGTAARQNGYRYQGITLTKNWRQLPGNAILWVGDNPAEWID